MSKVVPAGFSGGSVGPPFDSDSVCVTITALARYTLPSAQTCRLRKHDTTFETWAHTSCPSPKLKVRNPYGWPPAGYEKGWLLTNSDGFAPFGLSASTERVKGPIRSISSLACFSDNMLTVSCQCVRCKLGPFPWEPACSQQLKMRGWQVCS